jgi:hypothetical protein
VFCDRGRSSLADLRMWAHDGAMRMATLEQTRAALVDAGYVDELVADGSRLRVVSSGAIHDPEDLVVSRVVRFGRISTAEEEALLFALATPDGQPVGTYAPVAQPRLADSDAAIVRVLDDRALPAVEAGGHTGHDHVAAIFDDRSAAQTAVDELRGVGVDDERIGLALREGSARAFERDAEVDEVHDAEIGVAAGTAVGFFAWMSIAALVLVPGGLIGLGGVLALGGGAALGGAMLGGYIGVGAGNRAFDERAEFANLPLEPGQTLVAVCSHGDPASVESIMERHGGHLLRRPHEG